MPNPEKESYKLKLKNPFPEVEPSDSEVRKINCPSCQQPIAAKDIHLESKLAKCHSCDGVFSIQSSVSDLMEKKKVRQELVRPEGVELFHYRDELEITMGQPWTVFEVLGTFMFPFFAFIFTLIAYKKGLTIWLPASLWLGSGYFIINALLRSRYKLFVNIDDRYLTVKWRPKNLREDVSYRVDEIDQLYVKAHDGLHSLKMIINSPEGQKHVTLISSIYGVSKAHFLEQEIERHLGIVDRVVPEES